MNNLKRRRSLKWLLTRLAITKLTKIRDEIKTLICKAMKGFSRVENHKVKLTSTCILRFSAHSASNKTTKIRRQIAKLLVVEVQASKTGEYRILCKAKKSVQNLT